MHEINCLEDFSSLTLPLDYIEPPVVVFQEKLWGGGAEFVKHFLSTRAFIRNKCTHRLRLWQMVFSLTSRALVVHYICRAI